MQTLSWIDDGGVTLPVTLPVTLSLREIGGGSRLSPLSFLCSRRCDLAMHVGCMGCGE